MGRAPLVLAALALAAGIGVGLLRPVPPWGGPLLVPAAVAGCLLAVAAHRGGMRMGGGALLTLMAWAGLLLGAATRAEADGSCLRFLPNDRPVVVHGRIAWASAQRLRVELDSVRLGDATVPCHGEAAARTAHEGAASAGERVTAWARWWSPPGAEPGPLRRPGAFLVDSLRLDEPAAGATPAERLRRGARNRVEALFGDQAPLAASLLLAQRDALDPEVRERFARAGLSHLLAISGLHVGLVCGILLLVGSLLRLGRRASAALAAAGTVGYVLLLGAPHSAARAALQLVLLLAATALQRPTRPEALVATAAIVLLALEPGALLSPGFQLSFAGVAGLLVLRRPLLRLLGAGDGESGGGRSARAWRWLADGLATSVAATLATAPIVAWHFSMVAPVGVVANLVAIPLLSVALPALVLALLAGWLAPGVGAFLAGPGGLALAALDRVAEVAAAVPGGAMTVHGTAALLLTAAAGAGYVVSRRLGQVRTPVRLAAWLAVAVMVLAAAPIRPASDAVEIHVIDVGQGDAVAIRTPARRWVLVDAGMAGMGYDAGESRVVPYLARRGARRVEGVVLTHPHADHTGGAAAVIRTLRPRWVGDPGSPAPSGQYLGLLRLARDAGVVWTGLRLGHTLTMDGVHFQFLHPEEVGSVESDPNDLSVVALLAYGDFRALLTGDATARVEDRVLAAPAAIEAHVLKVGHHGSHTSTTAAFLAAARPAIALVSAGRGNRYGHPHRVVLDRLDSAGVRVFRTDRHGSIVVRADGRGAVTVESTRGGME